MEKYFSKTAINYLKKIAEFEGNSVAKQVALQCLSDTNYRYVRFIQVIKSYRKLFPL